MWTAVRRRQREVAVGTGVSCGTGGGLAPEAKGPTKSQAGSDKRIEKMVEGWVHIWFVCTVKGGLKRLELNAKTSV